MAEQLPRTHPLQSREAAFARLPEAVRIAAEPHVAMADVRLDAAAAASVRLLGTAVPTAPNTWAAAGWGRIVWLGPDEWLVLRPDTAPEELEADLRASVAGSGGSVVDVSGQRTGLRLRGAHARDVLAKGCSIDLHPRAFPAGASAQTTLGQAGVVLLALSDAGDDYAVLVRSSFAGYLADWLLDAALEYAAPEYMAPEYMAPEYTAPEYAALEHTAGTG